jgi:hypothetical protein
MDPLPKSALPLAVIFLTSLLISIIFLIEFWPLTSFRMFSQLRVNEEISWQAKADTKTSNQVDYPVGKIKASGFIFKMHIFPAANKKSQVKICRGWMNLDRELLNEKVTRIYLYKKRTYLTDKLTDKKRRPTEELIYICQRNSVEVKNG